jgi:protein-S-isoprenylcysteine O-methyltransferase Ste14
MNPYVTLKWIWIVFGISWLLAAFAQKRSIRRQSAGSGLLQMAIVFAALSPFFIADAKFGFLRKYFVPHLPAIQNLGIAVMLAGWAFATWARFTLGRNWSGTVTVKENHVLNTRGPYAWVRHPIYTGLLCMLLGTALVIGTFEALLAIAGVLFALYLKLRVEEQFMVETFGEQYTSYRRRVKALVPHVI